MEWIYDLVCCCRCLLIPLQINLFKSNLFLKGSLILGWSEVFTIWGWSNLFRPHLFLRTTYWHPCAATGPGHSISWGRCRRENRGFHCYLYRFFSKSGWFHSVGICISPFSLEVLKLQNHHYQQQTSLLSSSSSSSSSSSLISTQCLFLIIPHIYHPGGHLETDHLRLQFVK